MNTTVVIPIHSLDQSTKEMLDTALESLNTQRDKNFQTALVCSQEVAKEWKDTLEGYTAKVVVNKGNTDYASQINYFVENHLDTPYFSILQFDDTYFDNYIMNINKYVESHPECDLLTPIVYETDKENQYIGFSNESVWAYGHMDKFGEFDLENVKNNQFYNYNMNGFTMKGETFIEIGGLKSNFKMFMGYEFLLRFLNLGYNAMVIPKLGFTHKNGREGSIFEQNKNMTEIEKRFWYNKALVEYHYTDDRDITYDPKTE